jgi:hypothetical protein
MFHLIYTITRPKFSSFQSHGLAQHFEETKHLDFKDAIIVYWHIFVNIGILYFGT